MSVYMTKGSGTKSVLSWRWASRKRMMTLRGIVFSKSCNWCVSREHGLSGSRVVSPMWNFLLTSMGKLLIFSYPLEVLDREIWSLLYSLFLLAKYLVSCGSQDYHLASQLYLGETKEKISQRNLEKISGDWISEMPIKVHV